ncbi:MAG: cyclase family protein [Solirubrobacteraceae bacterium]|nr:cyclase family protein [Solirubrobacteraceae bacterium]
MHPAPLLDISVGLIPELPVWTGSPGHSRRPILSRAAGDDANATELKLDVHCGTHIDAPRHFIDDGVTLEAVALERLNGPTFVAQIGPALDIGPTELDAAQIPTGVDRLLLRTSNSEIDDLYSTPFRTDYAALSPAGAEWVRDRGIDVIGIDYLSIQRFHDPPDAHVTILGAGIVIVEGLRLTRAAPGWHDMICMPILLTGAEAAPARVALRPLQQGTP